MTLSRKGLNEAIEHNPDFNVTRKSGNDISVEPSSIDLHLDKYIGTTTHQKTVKVWNENTYPEYNVKERITPMVYPGEFMLATTDEYVELPASGVGLLHGRSSVGRLGLFIHNAGLVDAGFEGQLTLELFNASPYPIQLKAGMRICQMTVHLHEEAPEVAYSRRNGNKYQGQQGPTPSRLYEDFEK